MDHFNLLNSTLIEANKIPGVRLFSNPVGMAFNGAVVRKFTDSGNNYITLKNPRIVKYGLAPGSSDTIGFRQVTISGEKIAQFIAPEIKVKYDKLSESQKNFFEIVTSFGGLAFEVRENTDVKKILLS